MRLLLLCATPEFTGPAELMLEDAATLRAAGHEVTVAFDSRRAGSLRGRVEALGLPIEESLDLCRLASPAAFAGDVRRLRGLLRAGRWETIHARFSHDHHVALLATAGLDRRRFRLLRSVELLHNAARGAARSLAYAGTDRFAVPSEAHGAALVRNHGVDPARIDKLPGRVDAARFAPGPSGLRAELGIPEGAPVVGIVSRIKPDRLHADLLRAFARARREVPDAWLVVVGRGEGEPEVRALADAMGLAARTRFAGYRTGAALADAYRAFDVKAWLAPGNDGTCRAVLEAMASGCAVLGGDFGAVAESVVDGETGRLCDPRDAEDTGRALAWLLADRRRAAALGAAGRSRVLARYTPAGRAASLLGLYERAWESGPVRPSHQA
ncbi:glycosyltransferase family 4 protein [Vulgatibacter sp.]|uniref:glycosyltransferase family 4 protein n=1 Tax=Vulgatibacter sp. TaxID=1971226 RepID=UPI003561A837